MGVAASLDNSGERLAVAWARRSLHTVNRKKTISGEIAAPALLKTTRTSWRSMASRWRLANAGDRVRCLKKRGDDCSTAGAGV